MSVISTELYPLNYILQLKWHMLAFKIINSSSLCIAKYWNVWILCLLHAGTVPNQSPTGTPTAEVHEDQSVQSSRNNTVLIASTVSAVVGGILALGIILVLLYSCRRLHLKTKQLKSSSLMQRRPSEASNVYLRSLSTSSADSDNGIASPTATKAFF